MAPGTLPSWAHEYLLRDAWTEKVFLDLLCGRDPEAAAGSQDEAIMWADERRLMGDRVEEAVVEGNLVVRRVRRNHALKRLEEIDKTLAEEAQQEASLRIMYGEKFFVVPRVAIEWAIRIPERFPKFPFLLSDLDAVTDNTVAGSAAVDSKSTNLFRRLSSGQWEIQYGGEHKVGLRHLKGLS